MMTTKRKAIFLDKDGTLIPDVPYNVDPRLITLQNGVIEGLKLLKENGYIFAVISNQSGVARGYFEYSDLKKVSEKLDLLLNNEGIQIAGYYYCPHHPLGIITGYSIDCDCRKPEPGLILQAAKDLQIDTEKSWMIGDILNDVEAGNKAGCRTVLLDIGNETEWTEGKYRNPTYVAADFLQASRFICNEPNNTSK